jgi:rifampicin phosphotransferase
VTEPTIAASTTTFQPPGAGQWVLDRSHFPGATTPICAWVMTDAMAAGMERVFSEVGVPARRMEARFVNGYMYTRLIPLIGGDKPPRKLPPSPILKLATRFHPEFRRRTKAATTALDERAYLQVVDDWTTTIRPRLVGRNANLQAVDVDHVDDTELTRHVGELIDHLRESTELHFYLHGHDLGPIARYLHHAIGWGLAPNDATAALAGASPSTARPTVRLRRLRDLIESSDVTVTTLDDVRAVSPEAATLLDEHLAEHGHVLATGYDLTSFTLAELPGVLLGSIRSAESPPATDDDLVTALRARVPASERDEFDRLFADARAVMDMRDDNGPQTYEWPAGLLRRALLAVGRRLVERGRLHEADHALELTVDEARSALLATLSEADAVAARSARRLATMALDPPRVLGADEPEPPLDVMPAVLAEMVAAVKTAVTHLGMDSVAEHDPMVGVGVGRDSYTGRVCTATSADEAIERLEPGDVLVVRATSPAFNAVLGIAGAVVTANGGALSHAAVLARELGIPAVVGVSGALDIADGAMVTVDPVAGRVDVLS